MFRTLIELVEKQRLGAAFAVLMAAFLAIGAIAINGEKPGESGARYVTASIQPEGPMNADGSGLMLNGYDPVAYFTEGRARRGVSVWTARWGDARFYFASEANRQAFVAEPTRFLPQFGGHDAEGVRLGELREADPTAFALFRGKLYMLQDEGVLSYWREDLRLNAAVAELAWPRILTLLKS